MKEGVEIADDQRRYAWWVLEQNKVRAGQKRKSEKQEEGLPNYFQEVAQKTRQRSRQTSRKSRHCFHTDHRVFADFALEAGARVPEEGH